MEETDLRSYFEQFGTITDLVRMTDNATGRVDMENNMQIITGSGVFAGSGTGSEKKLKIR